MSIPRVIPCLLLKEKGIVKTIQFKNPRYLGDPINAVKIFNEKEVDELIFLDITATIENKRPQIELIKKIADECLMPLAVGGGIRTMEDVKELFNAGAEKVSINSYAVENPSFLREVAEVYGNQSVVFAMDIKKDWKGTYNVYTHSGTKKTKKDPVKLAIEMEKIGAGEILVNSIDRDGTMDGFDIDIIKKIADAVTIPTIASGGAGKIEDIADAIYNGHASAVAAGSMFVFYGKRRAVLINYPMRHELEKVLSRNK